MELQGAVALSIPTTVMGWIDLPRNELDIRYGMVMQDAMRAASKSQKKLMKVCFVLCIAIHVKSES